MKLTPMGRGLLTAARDAPLATAQLYPDELGQAIHQALETIDELEEEAQKLREAAREQKR